MISPGSSPKRKIDLGTAGESVIKVFSMVGHVKKTMHKLVDPTLVNHSFKDLVKEGLFDITHMLDVQGFASERRVVEN